ncbi:MAG: hypothetical protein R3E82_00520 [Pseudomonadales bacterium]|nr:hypothetical protein [Pseudomonadales bacterium]
MHPDRAYEFHDADVIAPEVYARAGHPLEAFAWLRANQPIRFRLKASRAEGGS